MPGELNFRIHEILRKYWGFSSFRDLQEQVITSVLEGKDTLALMPTGGGKSLTFQIPGLYYDTGVTIIISPLVSLMKDQVDNLKNKNIKAVYFSNGMKNAEKNAAWDLLFRGNARFLYIAPERLKNERFIMELRQLHVNLIVVDEAHCISQWGYDFRPDYLKIKNIRKIKPDVPVLALTATATPEVAEDIMFQLDFKQKHCLKKSFKRENINYIIRNTPDNISELTHILSKTQGSTIIYIRSRERSKKLSDLLNSYGFESTYYHAGLDHKEKQEHQNIWKSGLVRIMVATNAFGMGIDKSDVRVVIHFGLPTSPEEYYQETGRAGRDGEKAYAVAIVSKTECANLRRHLTEDFPARDYIRLVYEQVCDFLNFSLGEGYDHLKEFDFTKFCTIFKKQQRQCRAALRILGQAGYMDFIEDYDKRSRMMMSVGREELYELSGISENAEKVLGVILRLYPGIFSEYKFIYETEISVFGKMDQEKVYEALLELSRAKIISYIPKRGLPLIHLLTSREEKEHVVIGKDIYEDRIKVLKTRLETMIDYAFLNKDCRVRRLLNYLGETQASDCGKCDVCRSKKKRHKQDSPKVNITDIIMNYLRGFPHGLTFQQLGQNLQIDDSILIHEMNALINEGFIITENDKYKIAEE